MDLADFLASTAGLTGRQLRQLLTGAKVEWSEEREAYHSHECPRCGEEWAHGSRQCDGVRERSCWECTPREERMTMGGPGKIEEPAEPVETTEEEAPANEDAGEGEEEEKSS